MIGSFPHFIMKENNNVIWTDATLTRPGLV